VISQRRGFLHYRKMIARFWLSTRRRGGILRRRGACLRGSSLLEKKNVWKWQLEVRAQGFVELLPARDPQVDGYDISAYSHGGQCSDDTMGANLRRQSIAWDRSTCPAKGACGLLLSCSACQLRAVPHSVHYSYLDWRRWRYSLLWESIARNQLCLRLCAHLHGPNKEAYLPQRGIIPPILLKRMADFIIDSLAA